MQKRYIGLIITSLICLILVLTYSTITDTSFRWSMGASNEAKKKDIAIVMAYDEGMPFYIPRAVDNKREYASHHGYELFIQKSQHSDLHQSWRKITYTRQLMQENPYISWFWWIDLDSIIMNPSFTLEEHVLDPQKIVNYEKKDILISFDCNGFNTASFFVRNTPWARKFLDTMIKYSPSDPSMYGEQRVMERLYRQDQTVVDRFSSPVLRTFAAALAHECDLDDGDTDSLYVYQPGDFLVHFANCGPTNCHQDFNEFWKKRKTLSIASNVTNI